MFLKITLAGNKAEFEEFTFLSRRASWVRLTVKKVYGSSGGVGIKEVEFYNEMCKQSELLLDMDNVRKSKKLADLRSEKNKR